MANTIGLFPSFGSGITGGIETSAEIAWESLTEHAHLRRQSPHLLCYGKLPTHLADMPKNVQYASSKRSALFKALTMRLRPKLVFVWHLGLLKLTPAYLRSQPKTVVYLHGIEAWRSQDRLTRYLFNHVDLFLSNSRYTWDRFLEYQPQLASRPHMVVPLGLGEPLTEPSPQPHQLPKLLMLSRLSLREDYKGHREIISVWSRVLAQIPTAQLVIAGEGDLRPVLEHRVNAMGMQDSIKFMGYVSEETKLELLSQCRAFAMPSRNEGFGLVYLEAMRMGRPSLVSTEDAGREVVNPPECGLAANVNDSSALVEAICQLLTQGSRWDSWSINARTCYTSNFTGQHFRSRLLTALSSIDVCPDNPHLH